jgi:hypothetical protein
VERAVSKREAELREVMSTAERAVLQQLHGAVSCIVQKKGDSTWLTASGGAEREQSIRVERRALEQARIEFESQTRDKYAAMLREQAARHAEAVAQREAELDRVRTDTASEMLRVQVAADEARRAFETETRARADASVAAAMQQARAEVDARLVLERAGEERRLLEASERQQLELRDRATFEERVRAEFTTIVERGAAQHRSELEQVCTREPAVRVQR